MVVISSYSRLPRIISPQVIDSLDEARNSCLVHMPKHTIVQKCNCVGSEGGDLGLSYINLKKTQQSECVINMQHQLAL